MSEELASMGRETAQPPEAPSGLVNTKHNCNSNRKKGKNCGGRTLVGPDGNGKWLHLRYRCKGYSCCICGPKKVRRVRKAIVRRALQQKLCRFLTLTLDPKRLPVGLTTPEKITYIWGVWRKMREYIRRLQDNRRAVPFIGVVELQSNGNPHLHILIGAFLPKDWISASWEALGGGWRTRIEYADIHRVSAYISKYVTDQSLCDLPSGVRRFSTSRGLALFERSKGSGGWVLSALPIEVVHGHAENIEIEHRAPREGPRPTLRYVTEKNGEVAFSDPAPEDEDELISFIAAKPSHLAMRFRVRQRRV